jgi:hypothetical protein
LTYERHATITELTGDDLADLMSWLEAYQAKLWDKQIDEDLKQAVSTRFSPKLTKSTKRDWAGRYEAHDAAALLAALPATAVGSTEASGQEF